MQRKRIDQIEFRIALADFQSRRRKFQNIQRLANPIPKITAARQNFHQVIIESNKKFRIAIDVRILIIPMVIAIFASVVASRAQITRRISQTQLHP